MKIACQSCQAKYTIADEKVLGRVVKIRCKKCGATIVINGNSVSGDVAVQGQEEPTMAMPNSKAFDYAAPQQEEPWTVNVADGDQRSMTTAEVVAQYKAGVVNDETYCWRDGMSDWLPVREIDVLVAACGGGAAAAAAPAYAPPPAYEPPPPQQPAMQGGGLGALFGGGDPVGYSGAEANGNGASHGLAAAPAAVPAAARRAGGRAGGADLFGAAAEAGGENDVMTSAPRGAPAVHDDGKLTGQRNENSVLFSLSALTQNAPKEESQGPQGDGSGLIDIRALSANMAPQTKKNNHVDDIMNLGGGGAFSAALAAPVLAPPTDAADPYAGIAAGETKKTNPLLFVAIGVGALVAILLVVLIVRKPEPAAVSTAPAGGSATASAGPVAQNDTPPGTTSNAVAPAPTDTAAAPTPTGAAPVDPTKPSGTTGSQGGSSASSGTHKSGGGTATGGGTTPSSPSIPAAPPPSKGGGSFEDQLRKAAGGGDQGGGSAPAPAAGSAPFDRGAAAAALGAVNVASCKRADGPTGSGHVSIKFNPDGSVGSAVADQPPFQGTAVGGCVAGKFRGARVPAFSGSSITVGKSFVIN